MAEVIPSAILFYSTGSDSTVMLDLMAKYFGKDKLKVIFLYTIPDLSFKLKLFKKIKDRYDIDVIQEPSWDMGHCLKKAGIKDARIVTMGQQMNALRAKYDIPWCSLGWIRSESMARAITIKSETDENCIDWKYKKLYPVANFKKTEIESYIKNNKLLLSSECSSGYRNIDIFKGETALWLKNNYPDDFERALKIYPYLAGEVIRGS